MTVKVFYHVGKWAEFRSRFHKRWQHASKSGRNYNSTELPLGCFIDFPFFFKRINCHMAKAAGSVGSPPTMQSARAVLASGKFANTTRWPAGSWLEVRGRGLIQTVRAWILVWFWGIASLGVPLSERRGSQWVGGTRRLAGRNQAGGCKQRVKHDILWKPRRAFLFILLLNFFSWKAALPEF